MFSTVLSKGLCFGFQGPHLSSCEGTAVYTQGASGQSCFQYTSLTTLFPCQISWLPSTFPSNRFLSFNWKVYCVITALVSQCCILAVDLLCPHCFLCCFWVPGIWGTLEAVCNVSRMKNKKLVRWLSCPVVCLVLYHVPSFSFVESASLKLSSHLLHSKKLFHLYKRYLLAACLTYQAELYFNSLETLYCEIWSTARNLQRSSTQGWISPDFLS